MGSGFWKQRTTACSNGAHGLLFLPVRIVLKSHQRGKSDKADAIMISEYGWLRRENLKSENLSEAVIIELKDFISLRDKLITDRSGYKARIK